VSAGITILHVPTGAGGSIASGDTDRMNPEPDTVSPEPTRGGGAWVRPVVLVAACLIIGFVTGWVFRGDDGPVTILAPATPVDSGPGGSVTTGGTSTTPAPATGTTPAAPAPPPARADISLIVLNGTSQTGLAGRIAAQAESLGYSGVTAGNAPTSTSPSIAYFAPGRRAAAQRVAKDLQITTVQPLPASGPLATATPAGSDVAVVLGPG
jgi:hypothetical protein